MIKKLVLAVAVAAFTVLRTDRVVREENAQGGQVHHGYDGERQGQ